jgi:molybdenum cofactor cytidylyltransferase
VFIGIVLAAGRSARMGRPKALLRCHPSGETFAARVVRTLREGGLPQVLVVGRPDDDGLRAEIGRAWPSVPYIENPAPDRGQLSSLIVGIDRALALGAGAVMVMPVDIPQVLPSTVAAVLAASAATGQPIVRASFRGRHGHPVIFREEVFDDLRGAARRGCSGRLPPVVRATSLMPDG